MARYVVAAAADVPPGGRLIVDVEGRSIGIFNVDGDYLAVRNRCPHQGGPLCEGVQIGALTSEGPGHYAYDRANEIIRCPWHAWEFDLRTGASWFDPERTRVRAYEVEVVAAERTGDATPPRPGLLPGPYTAELVPVAVEGDVLVVEIAG